MSESVLLIEESDGIAELTLNRPDKRNALSRELRKAMVAAFYDLSGRHRPPVIILTGAGEAFTAGLDLKELSITGIGAAGDGNDPVEIDVVRTMDAYPAPIIGAVGGVAVTGGFEIALACDLLIASSNARFADTHARVGILPGWGLSQRLPRLIGIARAKELSLTGNYISAEQAERWGLVNRVVEPEELLPVCRELARDMASCEPNTMVSYKRVIDDGYAMNFADAMAMESRRSKEHARTVSAEDIAARRAGVQARGKTQKE
jgi:enoyl-CoA hydratase